MIKAEKIQELLLGAPTEVSEEQSKAQMEAMAHLSVNPTLKDILRIASRSHILDALCLLADRKFEEAFAALQSFSAVEEMESELLTAKQSWDEILKAKNEQVSVTTATGGATVKY